MSKYFVEYGALQANARRLIECDTSALPAKKITEAFAREIADALNSHEPGGAAASMTPVATCDGCGRPIHWGNLPNGIPNGVTLKDCGGVPGNDVTLCAACLARIGAGEEA